MPHTAMCTRSHLPVVLLLIALQVVTHDDVWLQLQRGHTQAHVRRKAGRHSWKVGVQRWTGGRGWRGRGVRRRDGADVLRPGISFGAAASQEQHARQKTAGRQAAQRSGGGGTHLCRGQQGRHDEGEVGQEALPQGLADARARLALARGGGRWVQGEVVGVGRGGGPPLLCISVTAKRFSFLSCFW